MAWKVESWSRELGRGTIYAGGLGSLPFDAAVADIDDFIIGEAVIVQLQPLSGTFRVNRVTPDIPRFRNPSPGYGTPAVDEDVASRASKLLAALPQRDGDRIVELSTERLLLEGVEQDPYAKPSCYRLVLRDPQYVELPLGWETRFVRVSTIEERCYLASRFDWDGAKLLAITWVTTDRHFHFAVGASLEAAE